MPKKRSHLSNSLTSVPMVEQPTVVYPVVTREPLPHDFSEEQFRLLEEAGEIHLTAEARRTLQRIAATWIAQDEILQSPRPRDFQRRLQEMAKELERMIATIDLNHGDAPISDRHLYMWLINAGVPSLYELLEKLTVLIQDGRKGIDLLQLAQASLPKDEGRRRPMNEDRFIIHLAEQFEASGGQAVVYSTVHSESGYGNTSFRDFVHKFYELLPVKSRRTSSGLDETAIRALKYRRRHSKKG